MKVDLRREVATYRAPRGRFEVVEVAARTFLMINGAGDPNGSPAWDAALRTIYPAAHRLRVLSRDELGLDHVVMPLEALWWSSEMTAFTTARDAARWEWTMMIGLPDLIAPEHVEVAREAVARRGGAPALDALRCERLVEGTCVQTLHVGPYAAEGPVLAAMHQEFIPGQGLRMTGKHHEVYLGDARRAAPERLRTILRQPVAPA